MAPAQVVDPSAQMWSPSRSSTIAATSATRVAAVGRVVADRGHPDVDRLDPGVGRDLRVPAAEQRLAEDLRDLRFPDAGQPERPARDVGPEAELAQGGHGVVVPHRSHLARRAGQGHDDPAVARSRDEPAGRRAVRIGQGRGRRDAPGLLDVRRAGTGISRRAHRPRNQASSSGSTTGSSPSTAAMASRVRSSGVGPRPPVETTRSTRESAVDRASVTTSRRSGSALMRPTVTPAVGQRSRELAGIGVARLADGQLRADAQELGGEQATRSAGRRSSRCSVAPTARRT